jgi:hypothetical protein
MANKREKKASKGKIKEGGRNSEAKVLELDTE